MGDKVKVFQLNECEWYAAESLKAVTAFASELTGIPVDHEDLVDDPHELSDAEMESTTFLTDMENPDTCEKISFAEQLRRMVGSGAEFPCFFAGTEY